MQDFFFMQQRQIVLKVMYLQKKKLNKVSTPEPTPDSTVFDTPKPTKSQTNK